MPIANNEMSATISNNVAEKKLQEGMFRIMVQHEMLDIKNSITEKINRESGKKTRANTGANSRRERNLTPELLIIKKIQDAKKRVHEMQMAKPQLASLNMNAILNGNLNDIEHKNSIEYWQGLPKVQQNKYKKAYEMANTDERHALIQYYSTDKFYEDYPTIYDNAKRKLDGQLQMNTPAGSEMDVYNSNAINKLFDNKYPSARKELSKQMKSDKNSFGGGSALMGHALTGISLLNPTGFLIGKAFSALMNTKAMEPLRQQIDKSVAHVAEKSGIKSVINSVKKTQAGRITIAAAMVTGVAVLAGIGIMNYDDIPAMASDLYSEFVTPELIDSMTPSNAVPDLDEVLDSSFESDPKKGLKIETKPELIDSMTPSNAAPDLDEALDSSFESDAKKGLEIETKPDLIDSMTPSNAAPDLDDVLDDVFEPLPATIENVVPGDSLSDIAKARLEQAGVPIENYAIIHELAKQIAAENGMDSIHNLQLGELKLPPLDQSIGEQLQLAANAHDNEVYAMDLDDPEPLVNSSFEPGMLSATYTMSPHDVVNKLAIENGALLSKEEILSLANILVNDNPNVAKFSVGDLINVSGLQDALINPEYHLLENSNAGPNTQPLIEKLDVDEVKLQNDESAYAKASYKR